MVTRLYFHAASSPLSNLPTAEQSSLTSDANSDAQTVNRSMDTTIGISQASLTLTSIAASTLKRYYYTRFVSDTLSGITSITAQTWTYNFGAKEQTTNANFPVAATSKPVRITAYVWRPGTGKVGDILDGNSASTVNEPSTNNVQNVHHVAFTGSLVSSVQDGDVICFEVWFEITQNAAQALLETFYYDGTVVNTTENAAQTDNASFLETPQNLTFGAALTRVSLSQVYKNKIVGRISLSRIYKNKIGQRISLSRIYKNKIGQRVSLSRIYKNKIVGRISLSRIYKNKIIGRISLTRIYKNKIGQRVSLSRIYKNRILNRISLSRIYKNKIGQRVSLSRIYKNQIVGRISLLRTYLNKILNTTQFYNVPYTGTSSGNLVSTGSLRYGIVFETSSALIGQQIGVWKNKLKKVAGATGNVTASVYNTGGTLVASSNETIDASTLATTYGTEYTWTFATPRTIAAGDKLVIEYSGATTINIMIHNTDQYDAGLTRRTRWDGTSWISSSTEDIDGTIDTPIALTRISLTRIYKNKISGRISLSRIYKNKIIGRISLSRIYKNKIQQRISLSRIYKNKIVGRISLSRIYKNKIQQRISLTRIYKNRILTKVSLTRIYKNKIQARVSLTRIYKNQILVSGLTRVSLQQTYINKIQARVSLQRTYKNKILSRISLSRIYKNKITGRVSLTRIYKNRILSRVSLSRIYKNKILTSVSLTRIYKNKVLGHVSLSRTYKNKIVGRISLTRIYKNQINPEALPKAVGGGTTRDKRNRYRAWVKSWARDLRNFFKIKPTPPPPEDVEIPPAQSPKTVTILSGPPTAKTKLQTLNDKWSVVASTPPPEVRTEIIYPVIINPSTIPLIQTKVTIPEQRAIKQPVIPPYRVADGVHMDSHVVGLRHPRYTSKAASVINTLMILLEIERQL